MRSFKCQRQKTQVPHIRASVYEKTCNVFLCFKAVVRVPGGGTLGISGWGDVPLGPWNP